MIGSAGMRALLLQALNPVAMRGVADHSGYRDHTWDRLTSTGQYLETVTFGSTAEALAAGARVRGIHARLGGTDPVTGTTYRADDPDLLLWIHCALIDSILDVVGRSRPGGISHHDADRYVAEQVRFAELVGLDAPVVPASRDDLAAYHEEVRQDLRVTRIAREAASYIIAPPMPPLLAVLTPARPAWAALAGLSFAALPAWARRMYALPELPGSAGLADGAATLALRGLRAALAGAQNAVPVLRDPRGLSGRGAQGPDATIDLTDGGPTTIDLTAVEPAAAGRA